MPERDSRGPLVDSTGTAADAAGAVDTAVADLAASAPEDPGAFEARVRAIVVEHVAVLLQERLFVVAAALANPSPVGDVATRPAAARVAGPAPQGPTVLALDTSGRQVVVEIARVLDETSLARCLSVAGRSVNDTRADLAERYAAGERQFHLDVARFYDSVPLTDTQVGGSGAGIRLVVVCGEVDPGVHDALRFLQQAGSVVDVVPLTWQTVDRIAQHVRALRAREAQAAAERGAAEQAAAEHVAGGQDAAERAAAVARPVAEQPVVEQPPVEQGSAAPAIVLAETAEQPVVPASAADQPAPDVPTEELMAQRRAEAVARAEREQGAILRAAAEQRRLLAEQQQAPLDADEQEQAAARAAATERARALARARAERAALEVQAANRGFASPPGSPRLVQPSNRAEPMTITTELPLRPEARPLPRTALPRPANAARPAQALAQKSAALQAAVTGIPVADASGGIAEPLYRDLRVLCAEISSPVPLVWVRERRGERHEALLHPSGVIEVSGGARYRNPSKAATDVSGSLSQVDGWSAWRFGDNGPTLAEAWTELYG